GRVHRDVPAELDLHLPRRPAPRGGVDVPDLVDGAAAVGNDDDNLLELHEAADDDRADRRRRLTGRPASRLARRVGEPNREARPRLQPQGGRVAEEWGLHDHDHRPQPEERVHAEACREGGYAADTGPVRRQEDGHPEPHAGPVVVLLTRRQAELLHRHVQIVAGAPTLGWGASASTNRPVGLRERKKQRTRQAIVESATGLFAERGYGETTLAEVAEQA